MTEQQFEILMGKMDRLIGAVNSLEETLTEMASDLTTDNEGHSYRLPELLIGMTNRITNAN